MFMYVNVYKQNLKYRFEGNLKNLLDSCAIK